VVKGEQETSLLHSDLEITHDNYAANRSALLIVEAYVATAALASPRRSSL
jgi:hypothetical protein